MPSYLVTCPHSRIADNSGVRLEQGFGVLQIGRVETLLEPAVDWGEQIAGVALFSLLAPEPGEADGGTQFPQSGALLAGDGQGTAEACLRLVVGGTVTSSNSPRIRCNSASNQRPPVRLTRPKASSARASPVSA